MGSFLGVPVSIHGRSIGNLDLADKAGGFSAADQRLVELFAGHAAIAMQNARLHEQAAALAIVEERERIGRDLHDGVIQSIYGVSLALEDLPALMREAPDEARRRIARAIEHLNGAVIDIRRFLFEMDSGSSAGSDLPAGLTALVSEFRADLLPGLTLHLDPQVSSLALAPADVDELLALVREALANVVRHAQATKVALDLEWTPGGLEAPGDPLLRLSVVDDGRGFDPAAAPGPPGHRGLTNLRTRVAKLGGRLIIESNPTPGVPDPGTRLFVEWPLAPVFAIPRARKDILYP
jgi:signal transduction histidine kinase